MSDAHILQVIGLIYLLIGIGMLFNKKYLQEVIRDLTQSLALSWIFSILAVLMGFLIINRQADTGGWSVLISIIGWIAIVKGGMFLVAPKAGHGLLEGVLKQKWVWALAQWVILLGGALLSYVGFFVL